ncbi:hypothetical protein GLYMA_03G184450v4 [Glycine max]|nr:hypothetical protein GLYMA_03G184450v4 [Glycine max]
MKCQCGGLVLLCLLECEMVWWEIKRSNIFMCLSRYIDVSLLPTCISTEKSFN